MTTTKNWYWIDGTAYCPACVECDTPAADAADCTRGPASGRCACCHHAAEGEIDDAETETEAVTEMRAAWPAATVSVVDAGDAGAPALEVSRYSQDGTTYICAGDADTTAADARTAAEGALRAGERLADSMERIDGCCTWTVIAAADAPRLMDYHTGDYIRAATDEEIEASRDAGPEGVILLAHDGSIVAADEAGADDARRVYVEDTQ